MDTIIAYFFNKKNQVKEIGWFRNALYLFLLYKAFVYIYQFRFLFSDERLIYHHVKYVNFIVNIAFFLNNHYSVFFAAACIFLITTLALLGLLKRSNFATNFLLWLIVLNLTNFLYPTLTAGDYLLNQLLFFNCFLFSKVSVNIMWNDVKTALHNMSLIAIKAQVCLAYFLAGYFKVIDDSWTSGEAIYQTFQIPEFSNALFASIPHSLCVILTYITIVYQLSFPFLVWFRPFKIYLFSFGILQHLFIAFGMGLVSFGLVMIICYILFLKYDY